MLTQLTNSLTDLITNLYVSTGLLGIVLAMAIESCCIPLPSEIVMPVAGIMIASGKILHGINPIVSLVLVALAGASGCLIGSIAAYGIGYSGGRPLMLKYGRYLLISQHDADKADQFFHRWGSPTAFFSRLLPVIRTYISLPAGIAKMPFIKFCIYTFLGSFPWCLLLAYVGTIVGKNRDVLAPYFHTFDVLILIILVALVALYIWRHIRNDRIARAVHISAEATAMQEGSRQQQPQQNWNQQPQSSQNWGQQSPSQFQQQQAGNQPPPLSQSQSSGWGQQGQQPSQPWGQPPQGQPPQGWNQQVQFPQPQQQGWGQPPQQPQFQPQPNPEPFQPQPQADWGQQVLPQSQWPPQSGDSDRTVRRG